ncbi:MAG: Carboxymethylenebutenolidase [Chloroflexi bacterium]|nr:Carboxymethylenebutenolidase [Chloroflexota bacterium]
MPGRYRKTEANEAWAMIVQFLDRVAQGAFPSNRVVWRLDSVMAADYDFTKNVRMA